MAQELQVIQDYYDLSLILLKRVQLFPRNIRYGLGRCLEDRVECILALLIRAKYSPKSEKSALLQEVNLELEILRFQLRQSVDLKAMPHKTQFSILEKLQAIGQQVGGWKAALTGDHRK